MNRTSAHCKSPGIKPLELISAWLGILKGRAPLLSIEITRECPLHCPGCYAYNDQHLGGVATLRQLSDLRGDALVNGVIGLVRKHRPVHVSLVGGEPLMRKPELERILPALSDMGIFTLLVTSAVAPFPAEWMRIPRLKIAVSVDGLPEHHDVRRTPATYERILRNIEGRRVNVHLTITRPMLQRASYLDEYFDFWSSRPEVDRIWVSTYTPQVGENSPEMLTAGERAELIERMADWRQRFPNLLMNPHIAEAFASPPQNPSECVFARMSVNYSADLKTRVEPCIFGGTPDCAQCGCASSVGLHSLRGMRLLGPLKIGDMVSGSMRVGSLVNRLRRSVDPTRWHHSPARRTRLAKIEASGR